LAKQRRGQAFEPSSQPFIHGDFSKGIKHSTVLSGSSKLSLQLQPRFHGVNLQTTLTVECTRPTAEIAIFLVIIPER
jgi:hypothetical protein